MKKPRKLYFFKKTIFTIFCILLSIKLALANDWDFVDIFTNDLRIPSALPPGAIVSRYSATAKEICGVDNGPCVITSVVFYDLGSSTTVHGPNVRTVVSGISVRILADGVVLHYGSYPNTPVNTFEIQLIRDGRQMEQSGIINGDLANEYAHIYIANNPNRLKSAIRIHSKITVIPGACSIEDKHIELPEIKASKLNYVGEIANTTPFVIGIYNCPPGLNKIKYSVSQIYSGEYSQSGVLNPSGSSTAKGVAIKITDDNGSPIEFDVFRDTGYSLESKAQSQSFSIPLKASYVKTNASVTPGHIESGVRILLDYQ